MQKREISLICCCIALFVAVFLFAHFSKRDSYTQVVYQTESSQQTQSAEKKPVVKSSGKKETSAQKESSKKESFAEEIAPPEESIFYEESTLYTEISLPEKEESVTSLPEESKGSEVSRTENVSAAEVPSTETKEEHLERKYHLDLTIYTQNDAKHDGWVYYTEQGEITAALEQLEGWIGCLDHSLLQKIARKGYPLKVTLMKENHATDHAVDSSGFSKGEGILLQENVDGKAEFIAGVAAFYCYVMKEIGTWDAFCTDFSACNPADFRYGRYMPQYIGGKPEKTYFLEVDALRSLQEDVSSLYTADCCGRISAAYLVEECPIFRKLKVLSAGLEKYLA